MFQIDAERANSEVAFNESRRRVDILVLAVMAKSVEPALARLDLDHFRAIVGEQPSRIRPGVARCERQDAHAFEDFVGGMHKLIPIDLLEG